MFAWLGSVETAVHGRLRWYDVQDSPHHGAAIDHAIAFGRLHARSDTPARELTTLAAASWQKCEGDEWATMTALADAKHNYENYKLYDAKRDAERELAHVKSMAALAAVEAARKVKEAQQAARDAAKLDWHQIGMMCLVVLLIGVLMGAAVAH